MHPGQIHGSRVGRCLQDGEMSKGFVSQWFLGPALLLNTETLWMHFCCSDRRFLPNPLSRTGNITSRDCSTRQRCSQTNNQLRQRHNKLDEITFKRNLEEDLKSHESRFKVSCSVASRNMLKTQRCETSCLRIPNTSATEKKTYKYTKKTDYTV